MKSLKNLIVLLVFFKFSLAQLQCPDTNCCMCTENFLSLCRKCCSGFELSSLGYCEATGKFSLIETQENDEIQKFKVNSAHLISTVTSKITNFNNRILSSCQVEKCIQCEEISNKCVECQEDYILENQVCLKSTEENKNGSVSIGLIIVIILVPLFFTAIFCFL